MTTIGANLAHLRNSLGLSQQQLADYLGVNRVEISYFENDQRPVPNPKLIMLADLAGLSAADLCDPQFTQTKPKVQFRFQPNGFETCDLHTIAEFQRIAHTYLRFKRLSKV